MGNRIADVVVGLIGIAAGLPSAWRWLTGTEEGQRAGIGLMALWIAVLGGWVGWQLRGAGGADVVRAAELDQAAVIAELRGRVISAEATAAVATGGADPMPARFPNAGEAPPLASPVVEVAAPNTIEIPWLPETVRRWEPILIEASKRHKVDPELLAIVMLVESGGNPIARSSAGATGLMQVMPATGRGIASERGIAGFSPDDLYDPEVCIDFGAWYLAQQLRSFGRVDDPDWAESVRNAAVAYNGGPGTAQRFVKGSSIPAETRSYVTWVGGMWAERRDASSPTLDRWLAAGGARLVQAAATAQ